jgi:3-hydroxyisobutyrate dehydrogenase-like beta-hydroxyacid dehydrogenase
MTKETSERHAPGGGERGGRGPLAFVGLGRMGWAMAERLAQAGFDLRVWNRTRARAEELRGARVCDSPREAASGASFVVTSLADDVAVRAVVLGADGVLAGLGDGAVHVSTSTISPPLMRALADAHAANGRAFVASPVLGRPDAAARGELSLLIGGDDAAVSRAQPVLDVLGRAKLRIGDPFQASLVKIVANFMIAGTIELLAEATTLGEKAGIAPATLVGALSETLLGSPALKTYGARIAAAEYEPAGFAVPLGLKDVELALAAGRELRVPLPAVGVVRDHLIAALARGREAWDWSALASVVREDAGLSATPGGVNRS